jgi:hypothetical protein
MVDVFRALHARNVMRSGPEAGEGGATVGRPRIPKKPFAKSTLGINLLGIAQAIDSG